MSRVLVVDDSNSMRKMVALTLTSSGFEVVEADDGRTGLDAATTHRCDAVIADVNMPNMNGIEMVREIRKLAAYRRVPIMMLTTESSVEMKQLGREAGATGWIVKPFDPDKLVASLNRVIAVI